MGAGPLVRLWTLTYWYRFTPIKLPCVCVFLVWRSLHFFDESFPFLFLFLCYLYFSTFLSTWSHSWYICELLLIDEGLCEVETSLQPYYLLLNVPMVRLMISPLFINKNYPLFIPILVKCKYWIGLQLYWDHSDLFLQFTLSYLLLDDVQKTQLYLHLRWPLSLVFKIKATK